MWLRHKPTGLSARLGTYYGHEWTTSKANPSESVEQLFKAVSEVYLDQRDENEYEVITESDEGWRYGDRSPTAELRYIERIPLMEYSNIPPKEERFTPSKSRKTRKRCWIDLLLRLLQCPCKLCKERKHSE